MRSPMSRATGPFWDAFVVRLIAAAPLLGIGLAHLFKPGADMLSLVQALGLPAAGLLAPIGVAIEVFVAAAFIFGAWVRLGALLVVPVMVVAFYAHLALRPWPNPGEPPIVLPLAITVCAFYLLWRGAGRLSLDARTSQ